MYNLLPRRDGEKRFFQGRTVFPIVCGHALLAMGDERFLRAAELALAAAEVEQAVCEYGRLRP